MPEGPIPEGIPLNPQTKRPYLELNGYSYWRLRPSVMEFYEKSLDPMRPDTYLYVGPTSSSQGDEVQRKQMWSPTIEITKEPRGWERFK